MSTTHNTTRGITLTGLANLGAVLDSQALPSGPETPAEAEANREAGPGACTPVPQDLAGLIAQLASLSGDLESMARQDAQAREQATVEVAKYETLLGERQDAERALGEARHLRATAEQFAAEAFTDDARAQAAQHAAIARATELGCAQLLAERTQATEDLAGRPYVVRALGERRRLAQEQADAAQRAEAERVSRLASGLAAVRAALAADQLDQAERLLAPLAHEFPDERDVHSLPMLSAGGTDNGWSRPLRPRCATSSGGPTGTIRRLPLPGWPPSRLTACPTSWPGVSLVSGRTPAPN